MGKKLYHRGSREGFEGGCIYVVKEIIFFILETVSKKSSFFKSFFSEYKYLFVVRCLTFLPKKCWNSRGAALRAGVQPGEAAWSLRRMRRQNPTTDHRGSQQEMDPPWASEEGGSEQARDADSATQAAWAAAATAGEEEEVVGDGGSRIEDENEADGMVDSAAVDYLGIAAAALVALTAGRGSHNSPFEWRVRAPLLDDNGVPAAGPLQVLDFHVPPAPAPAPLPRPPASFAPSSSSR